MERNEQSFDDDNNVGDDELSADETLNNHPILMRRVLRTRNLETSKPPPNFEEQIIRKRGRRQWEKLIPKTPPKRAVKRSLLNDNNDSTSTTISPRPKPNESPFTKCLRGLMSPIPKVNNNHEELSSSSTGIINRVLRSSESHKSFYYSPNPPYNLRSKDLNRTINDSGIGLTPDFQDTSSSTSSSSSSSMVRSNSLQSSSSSSSIKRINRVRRRFDFL
ncbi:hypothetical protein DERP_010908 [Dermatophagoides pteronyssinus]|uniref:Uncharacterized protein n=1 Tax=Dermatophagoides pteronyssinus TaxID=6956 RepID=A0ABQ8JVA3_DERPT|nr:hypothetical protein DERP_010908 [Dermatophagoides pteronyssinus]